MMLDESEKINSTSQSITNGQLHNQEDTIELRDINFNLFFVLF